MSRRHTVLAIIYVGLALLIGVWIAIIYHSAKSHDWMPIIILPVFFVVFFVTQRASKRRR